MSFDDDLDFDNILLESNIYDISTASEEKTANFVESPPENFNFPFEPYQIQRDFMQNLYSCIRSNKIGIFESPTGTGKSLSLICGALTALEKIKNERISDANRTISEAKKAVELQSASDDWLETCETTKVLEEKAKNCEKLLQNLKLLDERLNIVKQGFQLERAKAKIFKRKTTTDGDDDSEFLFEDSNEAESSQATDADREFFLDEYVSDGEDRNLEKVDSTNFEEIGEKINADKDGDEFYVPKVYYAVRTHSQLAQFLQEFRKTKFANDVRVTTLASRQTLCVNNAVKKLGHLSLINDRCVQLQKGSGCSSKIQKSNESKRSKKSTCPFYRRQTTADLADLQLAAKVQDLEDLVKRGVELKCCPYYASRIAVPSADLVLLPYQILLNKSVRESCNVRLHDSIVIIDEAHNLIDVINSIHSSKISITTVLAAVDQLKSYKERYGNRLKAKNLFYVRQLSSLLSNLAKFVKGKSLLANKERVYKLTDFLFDLDLADINFFKLVRYMEKSQISKKLNGFYQRFCNNHGVGTDVRAPTVACSFVQLETFIRCFLNASSDVRMLVHKGEQDELSWFKFISLNPSIFIKEILTECRSVIFAGGTMQPVSDFFDQLFYPNKIDIHKVLEFSTGHVIPDKNILPLVLCNGPTNVSLEFTYQNRSSERLIDELGRILLNLVTVIPGGMVCFFSSYEFENVVHTRLESQKVLGKLQERKKLFREPKQSSEVANLLENYARFIKIKSVAASKESSKLNGAILFAVVGGKMSEGINFSDDLARCVVMVGLPYPSKESVELQEKMKFLNTNHSSNTQQSTNAGQNYYENLCAKAVNQSIGRAIRHKNDYASILLLDHRYAKLSVRNKLPTWISKSVLEVDRFGLCLLNLKQFFNQHNKSVEDDRK